jgi:hypothetical protein
MLAQAKSGKRLKNLHYIFEFLTRQSPANPLWERIPQFCEPANCSRSVKGKKKVRRKGIPGSESNDQRIGVIAAV